VQYFLALLSVNVTIIYFLRFGVKTSVSDPDSNRAADRDSCRPKWPPTKEKEENNFLFKEYETALVFVGDSENI
jgi:hypothetical protein